MSDDPIPKTERFRDLARRVDPPDEAAKAFSVAVRGELGMIQEVLMRTMARIPEMDTPHAAEVWRGANIIRRDLAELERTAGQQLVELAPLVPYKYKGEDRMRPVKEQVVPDVGIVEITQTGTRDWHDPQRLAEDMIAVLRNFWARDHDGETAPWQQIITWMFILFPIGDPRVTKMAELGLSSFDDAEWCTKTYDGHRTARVKS